MPPQFFSAIHGGGRDARATLAARARPFAAIVAALCSALARLLAALGPRAGHPWPARGLASMPPLASSARHPCLAVGLCPIFSSRPLFFRSSFFQGRSRRPPAALRGASRRGNKGVASQRRASFLPTVRARWPSVFEANQAYRCTLLPRIRINRFKWGVALLSS